MRRQIELVASISEQTGLPATPSLDRHAQALGNVGPLRFRELIPRDDLAVIRSELVMALQPARWEFCAGAAAALTEWYPQRPPDHLKGYMRALAQDLAIFPQHIVEQALVDIRRTCKFMPSIAEVYQLALHSREIWDEKLRAVDAMELEYARREKEAEDRITAEEIEARCIDRFERAVAALRSGEEIKPSDLDHGDAYLVELGDSRWRGWQRHLLTGHAWSMRLALRVCLLLRMRLLTTRRPGVLDPVHAEEILRLARISEDEARKRLLEVSASPATSGGPTLTDADLRASALGLLSQTWGAGCTESRRWSGSVEWTFFPDGIPDHVIARFEESAVS